MFSVRINKTLSTPVPLKRGVPQGGVLSSILWITYTYDFQKPNALCHPALFADDIEFHTSAKSNEAAVKVLQPYLNRIDSWSKSWCLSFSVDKCVLLIFSRKRSADCQINLTLNNLPIPIYYTFTHLSLYLFG